MCSAPNGESRQIPEIVFKDGPSGRRAALAHGPDVWEVVKFLRETDEQGPSGLDAAAGVFALEMDQVAAAVRYYNNHRSEIDAQIEEAEAASIRAERAWLLRRQLMAAVDDFAAHPELGIRRDRPPHR